MAWSAAASGLATGLKAVWGSAADDVWAVGQAGAIVHRGK